MARRNSSAMRVERHEPGHELGVPRKALYQQLYGAMKLDRSSFDTTWQDLADYFSPRRIRKVVSDRNKGDRRTQNIIDSSARQAVRTLSAGMHSGITSPARPWFRLTTADPKLAQRSSVKSWLHEVETRIHTVFLRSNLYNGLPILYEDIGVFGTAAMGVFDDLEDTLRIKSYPVGSYVMGLDERDTVKMFGREYQLTVRQVVEKFVVVDGNPRNLDWSRASATVKNLWERNNQTAAVPCTWMVLPNDNYNPKRLEAKDAMPYRSCYWETGRADKEFLSGNGFLRESGFRQFPVMAPRWSITGEDTYGTDCPGITALGDNKSLQFMAKKTHRAVDKAIDPPQQASSDLQTQRVSLIPGDITYTENLQTGGVRPIHEVRLEGVIAMRDERGDMRQRVREAFYTDLFLMIANDQRMTPATAEEIRARQEEKLIALGPVLERLNDELLDPLIDRAFDILWESKDIPPPPEEMQGEPLRVEYISIMAQAQKLVGVVGQDRFINNVITMAKNGFTEVIYKVKQFKVIDEYADNPDLIATDEEASALSQQAAQQQAALAQAEVMRNMAPAAAALGGTPTQGGQSNALADVLGGGVSV
jgi:hypothetical protein